MKRRNFIILVFVPEFDKKGVRDQFALYGQCSFNMVKRVVSKVR